MRLRAANWDCWIPRPGFQSQIERIHGANSAFRSTDALVGVQGEAPGCCKRGPVFWTGGGQCSTPVTSIERRRPAAFWLCTMGSALQGATLRSFRPDLSIFSRGLTRGTAVDARLRPIDSETCERRGSKGARGPKARGNDLSNGREGSCVSGFDMICRSIEGEAHAK